MFFVGTAPSGAEGHVNISPKGIETLQVLGPKTVAYADYIGSGAETIAHLRENGRIIIMVCAFTGAPRIVRLHGRGEAIEPESSEFSGLHQAIRAAGRSMTELPVRSIIRIEVKRISDSCGFGVPLYQFEKQREQLTKWAARQGGEALREYQREKNSRSIDGLKTLRWLDQESST